jgi:hypothetical protein
MLGWPFAVLRLVVAFFTGIAGGVFTNIFVKDKPAEQSSSFSNLKIDTATINDVNDNCNDDSCNCDEPETKDTRHSVVRAADYVFVELLQDIAKWLVIGFLLAALISVALPENFFSMFSGMGIVELLVILAASIPLYICATGSIPIAAVLLMKGISPGAALVFLMAGPATNVATITVLGKTMGRKSLTAYLATIIGGALFFGLLINWLIPAEFILSKVVHVHGEHQMLPDWLMWTSAIVLIVSMVGGYFYKIFKKKSKMEKTEGITVKVTGMTCSHCEANVKRNLEALKGITNVIADNNSETVKITGSGFKLEKVKETVNGLGYQYVG